MFVRRVLLLMPKKLHHRCMCSGKESSNDIVSGVVDTPCSTVEATTPTGTGIAAMLAPKSPPLTPAAKAERQCYVDLLQKMKEHIENDENEGMVVPVYKKALLYGEKMAIKDATGEYTYMQLYTSAKRLSTQISNLCGSGAQLTVSCLCANSTLTTLAHWGCWMSGQVVMPMACDQPAELLYALAKEAAVRLVIATHQHETVAKQLAEQLDVALLVLDHTFLPAPTQNVMQLLTRLVLQNNGKLLFEGTLNNDFYSTTGALVLHTAGTTLNRPKGVRLSHRQLYAQTRSLVETWQFNCGDILLHALPLRCQHGLFAAFQCPLWVGGKLVLHETFNSDNVWSNLLGINTPAKERPNVFVGVPGIYGSLMAEYDKIFAKNKRLVEYIGNHCRKHIRLMVCGAARMPESLFRRWADMTGHHLLECYASTEMGVTMANPYTERDTSAETRRRPGCVGLPLPEIDVRLMSPDRKLLLAYQGVRRGDLMAAPTWDTIGCVAETHIGELYVAGEQITNGYVVATLDEDAFVDGFFRTGDIAAFEDGVFKILGRSSADIIETNGHRVHSQELESLLSRHPSIKDVAVFGVPDTVGGAGERISAICVLQPDAPGLDLSALHEFCANTALPTYKLPQALRIVDKLPRLSNEQINKPELLRIFFDCKTKL